MTRTIGTEPHKYYIETPLGEGGYSVVKLGVNTQSGERVALKVMFKDKIKGPHQLQRIRQEVSLMDKVQSEHAIRLIHSDFDAKYPEENGTVRDCILVVLELAKGGELFDYLMFTGKFSDKIARTYFQMLIKGLAVCHAQGIAHRDLKPENLLLDEHFRLKIADFGFSTRFLAEDGSENRMMTQCGTRGYMAPEVLAHKKYNEQADIFAAGVILFICLAGFPPFQHATTKDWWFHKLTVGRHDLFWAAHCRTATFTDDAKDFLVNILHPEPDKRLTIDQIQQHRWFKSPVLTKDELTAEVSGRMKRVEAEKRKERKKARQTQTARGVAETTRALTAQDVQSEGLPAWEPSHHLPTPWQWHTNDTAKAVLQRVKDQVHEFMGRAQQEKPSEVTAVMQNQQGLIRLSVNVFYDKSTNCNLVLFKRTQGDPINFNNVYRKMEDNLADLIADPSEE